MEGKYVISRLIVVRCLLVHLIFLYEFQLFLIRRRCYCLIELKLFDKAEEGLKFILSIDPENIFALQELEYIKQMKDNE